MLHAEYFSDEKSNCQSETSGLCVCVCMLSAGEINSYRDEIETQLAMSSRTKLRGIYASYAREGRSNQVLCMFI